MKRSFEMLLMVGLVAWSFPALGDVPKPAADEPVPTAEVVGKSTPGVAAAKTSESATKKVTPILTTVMLSSGTQISGTLLETSDVAMRTSFGAATIPLSEVAGIKLASEGGSTTVALHNGDVITGATEISNLRIETEWGKAEVYGQNISSLMFAKGMKWVSENGPTGTRWKLAEEPKAPAPAAAKPAGTAAAPRPVTSPVTQQFYPFGRSN